MPFKPNWDGVQTSILWWAWLFELWQRKHTTPQVNNSPFFEEPVLKREWLETKLKVHPGKNIMTTPRASSPYPDPPGTLGQLEPDTDDKIIDITDYAERPSNDKRSLQHIQKYVTHTMTQGHCPTPQTSPTYIAMNAMAVPANPIKWKCRESS